MVGRKKRNSIDGDCCNTDLCNRHIPSHSLPRKRQFSIILDTTTDAPNQTTTALTLPMLNATTATIVQNTSEPLSTILSVDPNTTTETITNITTTAQLTTTQPPPPPTVPTTVPTTTTTTLPPTTPAPSIELMSFI